jgi:hypothetical protein
MLNGTSPPTTSVLLLVKMDNIILFWFNTSFQLFQVLLQTTFTLVSMLSWWGQQ